MQIEELEVLIQANADQFRREVNDVNKKLDTIGKVASSSSAKTGASFTKMGAVAGAVGAIVAKGVDLAIRSVEKLAVGTTKMAMEAVESESLVGTVFGSMTEDITKWSNDMSDALGLNAYEVRKSAGVFYNIAEAMGVSQENALRLSKGIVSLSNDMASFYNLSTEEAVTKLRAGITGETEPLKQLGIVVDENTIKQTAYRLGIAQTGVELSNQQKVLARYMTIMEQTATAQGDLARTLESPANQLRILRARWEQLSITIGSIFIPILNAILPYVQALITLVSKAVQAIGRLFGIVGIKAVGTGQKIAESFTGMGDTAKTATKNIKALNKELAGLAGFDEMTVLKFGSGAGGTGGAIGGIGGGTDFVLPEYDTGIENIKTKAKDLAKTIEDFFKGVWDKLLKILDPAIKLWEVWVKPSFEGLRAQVEMLFRTISESPIGSILEEIGRILGVVIVAAIGVVINIFTALVWYIEWNIKAMVQGFNTWVDVIANVIIWFRKLLDVAKNVVEQIKNWFVVLKNNTSLIWNGIKDTITNVFNNIKNWVANVIDDISNRIYGLKSVFSTIANVILNVIKTPINGLITLLNNFIRSVNKIKIPDWVPSIGGRGFNIPTVNYLAEGGVITSPTLAIMGEGGYKEVVLPLERNTGWAEEVADLIGQNNGGSPINLVVKIGEDKIYEKVIDYINDRSLRTGVAVLNI